MTPVLFIAYHFPPIGGAGVQRSEKFVQYLPQEGYLPVVVTGPGPSAGHWTPNDDRLGADLSGNIRVLRAAGPVPQPNGRWTTKLSRWTARPDEFSQWWVTAGDRAATEALHNAELIFATMSPFSTAEFAASLAQRAGIPWIADLRDPWALDEMQIYPSGIHRTIERSRMRRLLSTAAGIVMNTPEATNVLQSAFPEFRNKKVATITNGYDAVDFARPAAPRSDRKFRIVHTGYLHTEMGLQTRHRRRFYGLLGGMETGVDIATRSHLFLLQAVERWTSRRPEVLPDLEIMFAGVATERDKEVAADSAVAKCVRFTGYLSHTDSVELVRRADLLFLPMHNLPAGKRSRIVPGKTYEYMASGRPILAAVPNGDARDFLEKSGTALICQPDDAAGMADQLDKAYSAWKQGSSHPNPNWDFIQTFERSRLTHRLAEFFNDVLATKLTVAV
ncbi:MAG: glycosyltransferase family 4 protein [Chthoniobacterales bacterium]